MAARVITPDELKAACQVLAERKNLTMSQGEGGTFTLVPGDIIFSLEAGSPRMTCADANAEIGAELHGKLREILMDMAESSQEPVISPRNEDRPRQWTKTPSRQQNTFNEALEREALVRSGSIITEEDIRNFLCPKASPQEILMAARLCQIKGMNWGDVHFIKYGDAPLTIVAGKEHFTKKAESSPRFNGYQAGIIVKTADGYKELEGTFCVDEELVGGWAKVWRKDRKEPFVQKVKLSSFDTKKALWSKMPEVMIRKVALVNALREAFPGDLGGLYDSSEMAQAGIGLDPANEIETDGRAEA